MLLFMHRTNMQKDHCSAYSLSQIQRLSYSLKETYNITLPQALISVQTVLPNRVFGALRNISGIMLEMIRTAQSTGMV